MESGFENQGGHEKAKHETGRQFELHAAADSQYEPGANQGNGIGKSYAAHDHSHNQHDGQNLDDFKFQLEESFHYSLQNSRGAAW
jgi:hypothetical protein